MYKITLDINHKIFNKIIEEKFNKEDVQYFSQNLDKLGDVVFDGKLSGDVLLIHCLVELKRDYVDVVVTEDDLSLFEKESKKIKKINKIKNRDEGFDINKELDGILGVVAKLEVEDGIKEFKEYLDINKDLFTFSQLKKIREYIDISNVVKSTEDLVDLFVNYSDVMNLARDNFRSNKINTVSKFNEFLDLIDQSVNVDKSVYSVIDVYFLYCKLEGEILDDIGILRRLVRKGFGVDGLSRLDNNTIDAVFLEEILDSNLVSNISINQIKEDIPLYLRERYLNEVLVVKVTNTKLIELSEGCKEKGWLTKQLYKRMDSEKKKKILSKGFIDKKILSDWLSTEDDNEFLKELLMVDLNVYNFISGEIKDDDEIIDIILNNENLLDYYTKGIIRKLPDKVMVNKEKIFYLIETQRMSLITKDVNKNLWKDKDFMLGFLKILISADDELVYDLTKNNNNFVAFKDESVERIRALSSQLYVKIECEDVELKGRERRLKL